MHATSIVGYTHQAENVCLDCTFDAFAREAAEALDDERAFHLSTEEVLDAVAAARGIDRTNEHSFDSDQFPKVVFADQAGGERCDRCTAELVPHWKHHEAVPEDFGYICEAGHIDCADDDDGGPCVQRTNLAPRMRT